MNLITPKYFTRLYLASSHLGLFDAIPNKFYWVVILPCACMNNYKFSTYLYVCIFYYVYIYGKKYLVKFIASTVSLP